MVDAVVRLFESTATTFETNGIGYLPDVISCTVIEERNGEFELEMKYPITGVRYEELKLRRLIVAKSNPYANPQPFRIYEITKPIHGIVTVNAEHICYDMSGIGVRPFNATRVDNALAGLKAYAVGSCPFNFYTDKNTTANFKMVEPNSMKSLLGGVEGSILDVYGGEYEFDQFNVRLWNHRGYDRGVTIRYGKNLTSLEQEENCANVYTAVYPYWYSEEDGLLELPSRTVEVEGTFNYSRVLVLDFSYEWTEKPTTEQLQARATRYIKENNIGVPKVSIDISFVDLTASKEYEMLNLLDTVHLCDTIMVEFAQLGVKATAKCIKTKYDVLMDRYVTLSLGDAKASFAETLSQNNDKLAEEFDKILNANMQGLTTDFNKELDETTAALKKEAEEALKKQEEDFDKKLDDAEESVNQRFIQVNERFAILDGNIIDLDTEIGKQLESIGKNIDDIEGDISNLFVGVANANKGIGDLNADLDKVDGDISGLRGSVSSLEQELKTGLTTEATNRELAIANATKKITGNLGGYVILHSSTNADYPDEILIMDTQNINTAKKIWRWNQSGLGYSKSGYNGPYELAMTQNGVFVADFIQAGVMSADRIKGGTLILGGGNNGNGEFALLDEKNNIIGVMNNTGIQMLKGQIKGPSIMAGGASNGNGIISVFDENNNIVGLFNNAGIQILKGKIKGPIIDVGGIGNEDGYINVRDAEGNIIGQWSKDGLFAENAYIRGNVHSTIKSGTDNEYAATMGLVYYNQVIGSGEIGLLSDYGFQVNGGLALTQTGLYGVERINIQTLLRNNQWFEIIMESGYQFSIVYRTGASGYSFIQMQPGIDGNVLMMRETPICFGGGIGKEIYFQGMSTASGPTNVLLIKNGNKYGWQFCANSSSSIRYKEVLRDMTEEDVEEAYNIQPVIAKYKDGYLMSGDEKEGLYYPMFIAEDVEKYSREAVSHNSDGSAEMWDEHVMIPVMFQMLKSQKKEIDMLKMEIEELKQLVKGD